MTPMDMDGPTHVTERKSFDLLAAYTATAVPIRLQHHADYRVTRPDGFRPRRPYLGRELRTIYVDDHYHVTL